MEGHAGFGRLTHEQCGRMVSSGALIAVVPPLRSLRHRVAAGAPPTHMPRGPATQKFKRAKPSAPVQKWRQEWGKFMGPLVGRLVTGKITHEEAAALYREHFPTMTGPK